MSEGPPPRDAKALQPPEPPREKPPGPRIEPPSTIASEGWAVLSTLIAGIAVWAGIGYGLDRLFGITVLLPIGLLLGVASGIYLVVVKYGHP
jgi:ATP synthase protein I